MEEGRGGHNLSVNLRLTPPLNKGEAFYRGSRIYGEISRVTVCRDRKKEQSIIKFQINANRNNQQI